MKLSTNDTAPAPTIALERAPFPIVLLDAPISSDAPEATETFPVACVANPPTSRTLVPLVKSMASAWTPPPRPPAIVPLSMTVRFPPEMPTPPAPAEPATPEEPARVARRPAEAAIAAGDARADGDREGRAAGVLNSEPAAAAAAAGPAGPGRAGCGASRPRRRLPPRL